MAGGLWWAHPTPPCPAQPSPAQAAWRVSLAVCPVLLAAPAPPWGWTWDRVGTQLVGETGPSLWFRTTLTPFIPPLSHRFGIFRFFMQQGRALANSWSLAIWRTGFKGHHQDWLSLVWRTFNCFTLFPVLAPSDNCFRGGPREKWKT